MTVSERELENELTRVEDPLIGQDVVSLGLVNDVTVEDGTATVSLAFNTPFAPTEMDLGNEIREVVSELGLEPDLRAQPGEEHGFDVEIMPRVRNIVAVASGKGGVGKTTVAANLAAGLDRLGASVGILDADIHGPNVPRILPVESDPGITPNEELVPPRSDGVRVASMEFLLDDDDDPAMLRGPMVNKFMMQFLEGVEWGRLDYLVVDLPPGTGDATFNLLQNMPVTGAVIVTTPQDMALDDARKGLRMFQEHDAPILGIVENMSAFQCPSCGDQHELFGRGGAEGISEDYDVPLLAKIPMHPDFGEGGTDGAAVKDDGSPVQDVVVDFVDRAADRIGEVNRRTVAENVAPETTLDDGVPAAPEGEASGDATPHGFHSSAGGEAEAETSERSGGEDPGTEGESEDDDAVEPGEGWERATEADAGADAEVDEEAEADDEEDDDSFGGTLTVDTKSDADE